MRVVATAERDFDPGTFDPNADLLNEIKGLTLLAMVGIVDPPRAEARDAIAECHSAGIRVCMITGDHAVTAGAIAKQLGIEGRAITGAEFNKMSDEEVDEQLDEIGVMARVAPEDKIRLVSLLQKQNKIVAMTSDGVNDAPALKKADIGVAMGITGTDVSKDAAVTMLTMMAIVLISAFGVSFLPINKLERYSHAIAGATIFHCGASIQFLGL